MPKIASVGPYRLFFYSNERTEPPHVHVRRERKLAKFWLDPVGLATSTGFSAHELRRIEGIIGERRSSLVESWHEFFNR